MANKQLSYDYSNQIRDMSDVFQTVVAQNPIMSAILTISNEPFNNTKLEWLDDTTKPLTWTTQGHTSGDGVIVSSNTDGIVSGMILGFTKLPGASGSSESTLVVKVGTVTANTSFTITVYGGSTDENLASGTRIDLISSPKGEGETPTAGANSEPVAKYNYSQIFEKTAVVSGTAYNSGIYGINKNPGDVLNYQIQKKLMELSYEIANTSIKGLRVQRSGSEKGTMAGWLTLLKGGTGNTVAGGGAKISSATLNKAFELIRSNGGMASTIVAHPVHAKNFSTINTAISTVFTAKGDTTGGSYMLNFATDFGDMATVVYSYNMPPDIIAVIDKSSILLRPFVNRAFSDEDSTTPGFDGVQRTVRGEYSLEVKNASEKHAYITGLIS